MIVYSNTVAAGRERPFNFNNRSWQSETPTFKDTAKTYNFSLKTSILGLATISFLVFFFFFFPSLPSPEWRVGFPWRVFLEKANTRIRFGSLLFTCRAGLDPTCTHGGLRQKPARTGLTLEQEGSRYTISKETNRWTRHLQRRRARGKIEQVPHHSTPSTHQQLPHMVPGDTMRMFPDSHRRGNQPSHPERKMDKCFYIPSWRIRYWQKSTQLQAIIRWVLETGY